MKSILKLDDTIHSSSGFDQPAEETLHAKSSQGELFAVAPKHFDNPISREICRATEQVRKKLDKIGDANKLFSST
jgi:hypothetical protein